MPKPSIGQSNWGQTLNDHLDTLQTQADLEADVAAKVGTAGPLDSALSASIGAAVPEYADELLTAEVRDIVSWSKMWLADDIDLSDGDPVNEWVPSIGTGTLAQATASRQPILVHGKFGRRKALSFSSRLSQFLDLVADIPQPYSAYAVLNVTSVTSNRGITARTPGGSVMHLFSTSSGGFWYRALSTTVVSTIAADAQITRAAVIADGASGKIRIDGVEHAGNAGATGIGTLVLGADVTSGGVVTGGNVNIAFLGIKAGVFTADELTALDAWASAYYGLAEDAERRNSTWSWWTRPRAVHYGERTYVAATGPGTRNSVLMYDGLEEEPTIATVGESGGTEDDHNNGALLIHPGKPAVLLYSRHSTEQLIKWRKGSLPIEQDRDLATLAAAAEQTQATPHGMTSYDVFNIHRPTAGIHGLIREAATGDWRWSYVKSTDWATTFTITPLLSHAYQFYANAKIVGDKMRVVASSHPKNGSPPDQKVYYCEIDLLTGSITKADGTVLGNTDGTGLPIAISSLTEVAAPTSGYVTWVYDVSDGPVPEVAWVEFTLANVNTTGVYKHSVYRSGAWTSRTIASAGKRFSDPEVEPYLGGAQYPSNSPGGRVYIAREAGDVWYVERCDTTDDGLTWTKKPLAVSVGSRLARAWPVESVAGNPPREVAVNHVSRFFNYGNMDSIIRLY